MSCPCLSIRALIRGSLFGAFQMLFLGGKRFPRQGAGKGVDAGLKGVRAEVGLRAFLPNFGAPTTRKKTALTYPGSHAEETSSRFCIELIWQIGVVANMPRWRSKPPRWSFETHTS